MSFSKGYILHDVTHRLNAEADRRIQIFSVKPGIEICRYVKHHHSLTKNFSFLENIVYIKKYVNM